MINPSTQGWINKYFTEYSFDDTFYSEETFYTNTRKTGFIFGHVVELEKIAPDELEKMLPVEITKLALLATLFQGYRTVNQNNDSTLFIDKVVAFYEKISPQKPNPLHKVLPIMMASHKLEKIIHARVQTNEDLVTKNFSHVLTNALLFVDVLAFEKFLKTDTCSNQYFRKIEEIVVSVVSISLKTKTGISTHDELLSKLFESSVRYNKFSDISNLALDNIDLGYLENVLEKYYVLDLAGISLWSDEKVENEERYFLYSLGEKLHIKKDKVLSSIEFVNQFINKHKHKIPYFTFSNPVKHFYEQTSENVALLIERNKKRLVKEISQSKELVNLLTKSTHKELSPEEKKKVKNQLLDICKSIPSLTIFLLPGGSLLLPILIKFIPKMLPSAFNENHSD